MRGDYIRDLKLYTADLTNLVLTFDGGFSVAKQPSPLVMPMLNSNDIETHVLHVSDTVDKYINSGLYIKNGNNYYRVLRKGHVSKHINRNTNQWFVRYEENI